MNWLTRKILKKGRKLHTALWPETHVKYYPKIDLTGQAAGDEVRRLLERDAPCLICRMGLTELRAICNYIDIINPAPFSEKCWDYITEKRDRFWWAPEHLTNIYNYSGFFPPTEEALDRFSADMLALMKDIDLLGSWRKLENKLEPWLPPKLVRIPLPDLEPFRHANPWSEALAGKKVLLVHPFQATIHRQFEKRKLLFKDTRTLPDFQLSTVKAVQTLIGEPTHFPDWFAALKWMQDEMDKIDYDIAIIGAGAYGFPLAAHAKKRGKKGFHMGGSTQLLFGIRGKRWDDEEAISSLYNEHWTTADERPKHFIKVEDGCYW